jgi:hypothetical protein
MAIINWPAWIWSGAIILLIFAVITILGAFLVGFVFVKLPTTYFCDHHDRDFWTNRHPIIRWTGRVVKNLLGVLLVILGVALSLPGIPGPGVLIIILGVTLLDFPGKRRLERWIVGRPAIFNAINRLRRRYGKPPIILKR